MHIDAWILSLSRKRKQVDQKMHGWNCFKHVKYNTSDKFSSVGMHYPQAFKCYYCCSQEAQIKTGDYISGLYFCID